MQQTRIICTKRSDYVIAKFAIRGKGSGGKIARYINKQVKWGSKYLVSSKGKEQGESVREQSCQNTQNKVR